MQNVKNRDGLVAVQEEFPIIHPTLQLPLPQTESHIRLHRFKLSGPGPNMFSMSNNPRQPQEPRLNRDQFIHVALPESIREGLQEGRDERLSKAYRLHLLRTTKNADRLPLSIQRHNKILHPKEKLTAQPEIISAIY